MNCIAEMRTKKQLLANRSLRLTSRY